MLKTTLIVISAVAFLFYGVSFLFNFGMKEEFERYGLDRFRKWIGFLQLLGGLGLLMGLIWPPILVITSAGLALLMMLGFGTRLKMRDGFWESMPSFFLMLLNAYICFATIYRR